MGHFFNTFLIVLASFTLIAHPVAQTQGDSPPVEAEEASSDQIPPEEEKEEEEERGTEEEVEEDAGASISLKDAKGEDWLTLISSLAAGFLAASVARNCSKKTMDANTVVAAGVAYLGSEIIATHKDKETRDDIKEDYIEETSIEATSEEGGGDASGDEEQGAEESEEEQSAQIKSLKAQEESYNELKETAEVKGGFQYAAAGLLATASGIAIYQWTKEVTQNRFCKAAATKMVEALPFACSLTVDDPSCSPAATTCQTALSAFISELEAFNAKKQSVETGSKAKMAELEAFSAKVKAHFLQCNPHPKIAQLAKKVETPCTAYLTTLHSQLMMCAMEEKKKGKGKGEGDEVKEPETPKAEGTETTVKNFLLKGLDLVVSKAHAFVSFDGLLGNMGIVGAAGGVALSALKPLKEKFDKLVAYPRQRAVLWTAMAGLMTAAAVVAGNVKEDLEKNAKYTAEVIQQYRNRNKDKGGGINPFAVPTESNNSQDISNSSIVGGPINLGEDEDDGIPCLTIENSRGQCARLESLSSEEKKELLELDPGIANIAQAGEVLGNGLNNKKVVSSATLKNASRLAGRHAFAFKRNKQLKNIAFKELKKDGSYGPVAIKNFESLGRGVDQIFKQSAAATVRRSGAGGGGALAALGSGSGASLAAAKGAKSTGKNSSEAGAKSPRAGGVPDFNLDFGSGPSLGGLSFDGSEGESKKKGKKSGKPRRKRKKLEIDQKMVEEQGQINKNANNNIFKTINLRYKKALYPLVFGE